ncbi:MAG: energy-coupling factor ABC transporter ATP-binding protein [Halodesulfurarchaeum sp.]
MIEVTDLRFGYESGPQIFDGLTVSIPAGETVAVLGANGTGKTTFLRLLAGLLEPTSGAIEIDGDGDGDSDGDRNGDGKGDDTREPVVGLTPETPADGLFAQTVEAEVAFFPENRGLPVDEHVERALTTLGIEDLADRQPHTLSQGEKRLVTIASVLSGDPDVIGLDEPTSGLDANGRRRLGDRVETLDRTVVLVTHDTDFAWRYADRVLVLTESGLEREGPTRDVLADPDFDPEGVGLRTPEPVRWARDHGVDPPTSVAEAVTLLEGGEK